jgi:hypothetical protein
VPGFAEFELAEDYCRNRDYFGDILDDHVTVSWIVLGPVDKTDWTDPRHGSVPDPVNFGLKN